MSMRPAVPLAVLLAGLALAGCSGDLPAAAEPTQPLLEGWIVDARVAPVVGARVVAVGLGANGTTDADGHYAFAVPPGVELVVLAEMPGFLAQSRSVSAGSGDRVVVNFTLERVPVEAPYTTVEAFDGILRCGVTAVVLEDPSRPHTHSSVKCSVLLEDDANLWMYPIPANTTGVVIEAVWEPQSDLSQSLVLNVTLEATGEVFGFQEGLSPLRAQTSQFKLALARQLGHDALAIRIEAGAGTGNHEHGAAGATVEQAFRLFATAFYNGPVDPGYSVTQA